MILTDEDLSDAITEKGSDKNFDEFPIQCYICDTVQAPDCATLKFEIREFCICKSCPHSHMIIVHCFKSGIWMFPPRIVVHAIDQSISGWLPKDADVGHSPTGAGSALSYSVHRCAS